MDKAKLLFLSLSSYPISLQLQLEEKFLKETKHNVCLINKGTSTPSIVLGISGKEEEHLSQEFYPQNPLPVIRRFSGGGTVVVDENTFFVTFIFNHEHFSFPLFSENILKWTEALYQEVFFPYPFSLRDNDYVFHHKKCGGNAQYLKKERWLHHTSFLWDYDKEKMKLLSIPKKQPLYRENREHEDFIMPIHPYFSTPLLLEKKIEEALKKEFVVQKVSFKEFLPNLLNET